MKIKHGLVGMVLALSFASPMALAVEGSYFYGAVDIGEGQMGNYCSGIPAGVSCSDKATANRLSVGYQIISGLNEEGTGKEGIGIEGSYVNAGQGSFSGPGVSANTKNTEWQLALMGTLPLDERFIIVTKAGVAAWKLNTTSTPLATGLSPTGLDFLWGLGVQLDINQSFALRCIYDSHLIGDSVTGRGTLATLSFGAMFRF